ncbi:hypothetical protein SDC9_188269 [bioreactor metagenome]|uniref:Uncharacterized protein n=1 Tax=bioreactor metagenome TaxID=1076179 RepID=A0A645HPG3_9ZZZZ
MADQLGQQCLGDGVGIVEGVHEVLHLVDDRRHHPVVAAAGGVNRDTGVKIQIGLAVFIVEILLLGRFGDEGKALIGVDHVFADLRLELLRRQARIRKLHV